MATPHCPAQGKCFLLGRAVAVGITDSRGFLAFLQELQKALGAFVVFTLLKEHGVLLDFTVEILRDDIAGTRNELTVLEALRKRNEAGLSIAGLHKLIGLADVVAQNGLAFNRFFQAEGLQRLVGSFAAIRANPIQRTRRSQASQRHTERKNGPSNRHPAAHCRCRLHLGSCTKRGYELQVSLAGSRDAD